MNCGYWQNSLLEESLFKWLIIFLSNFCTGESPSEVCLTVQSNHLVNAHFKYVLAQS